MLPRRSSFSSLLLSSAVVAAAWLPVPALYAQEAPATATAEALKIEPAKAPATDKKLVALADDFLHYSIVGNVALARDTGQAILNTNTDPATLLLAFEAAANDRKIPAILTRDQRQPELKEVAKKLQDQLEEGHRVTARDPERIKTEIQRLGDSPRAYENAKGRLAAAGQFAVPYYIQVLQDPKQTTLQPYVVRLMIELGRPMLPPLVEQLQSANIDERVTLVGIIGQIGYPQAVPFLKAAADDAKATPQLKAAVTAAINQCDPRDIYRQATTADAFQTMASQYYQGDPAVMQMLPGEATSPIWYYDRGLDNVLGVPVPKQIWASVQTLRMAERALKSDATKSQAISLWLAADLRHNTQLPAGVKDPTRTEGTPDAAFYARAAGPVYMNPVLEMALTQHDSPLVLRAITAVESTGGTQGLVSGSEAQTPLVKALSYPDCGVRFAAAFALARANPAKDYPGSFRVIPVLAEAVAQTGMPSILLVEPNLENRNRLKGILSADYNVCDGSSIAAALEAARRVAAFDVVIVPAGATAQQVREFSRTDYRLASAPELILTAQPAPMPEAASREIKPDIDDKALAEALAGVKAQIGQTAIDPAAATDYAKTAISLLGSLAVDHATIYNVAEAVPALTDALKDKRPEISTAAAVVLGQLNNADAQKALAAAALPDGTDAATRGPFLLALAESAKKTGNKLDDASIDKLIKLVAAKETDAAVRTAAATALGALNVPSNQASVLILQQVK